MNVVGMKSRGAQPHGPAAIEAPAALVTAAQRIGAMADVLEGALKRRGKGSERGAVRGVGTAGQIRGGLGAMAKRLKQHRMALGVVRAVEPPRDVGEETGQTPPRPRRDLASF